jgi:molecular chaperone HtpG
LRKDNIQIGDEKRLVKLHKEPRGNFYFFGEVHAVHPGLIPNARRDYFLQNSILDEFEKYLHEYFKELNILYYLSSIIRSAQGEIKNYERLLQNYRIFIDSSWFWLSKSQFFQRNPAAIAVTRRNGSFFPN